MNSTCDTPVAPNNGYVYTVHGIRGETCSVVQYTCAIGSELIGEPFAMCMPDGQWNFPPPICKCECQRKLYRLYTYRINNMLILNGKPFCINYNCLDN